MCANCQVPAPAGGASGCHLETLGQKLIHKAVGEWYLRPTGETQAVPLRVPRDPRLPDQVPLELQVCLDPQALVDITESTKAPAWGSLALELLVSSLIPTSVFTA